jgi:hypothetical protein
VPEPVEPGLVYRYIDRDWRRRRGLPVDNVRREFWQGHQDADGRRI